MIAWLSGKLLRKTGDSVIIDVGGVGYHVSVPLSTYARILDAGSDISLHIHTHLREDSLSLFGFSTELEKELFLLLMSVSGIGPKLALAVLSGLSVEDILLAVRSADDAKLCGISGVGKKTAARVCLELKDKIRNLVPELAEASMAQSTAPAPSADAVSALINLGYKKAAAEDAVRQAAQRNPGSEVAALIREALAMLGKR